MGDMLFTMDMALQFALAYRISHDRADRIWEKDPAMIARRYCAFPFSERGQAGWFWLDVVSVLPGWFEFFYSGNSTISQTLKSFRFLRLLRIARLTRVSQKVQEFQTFTGMPFFLSDIVKFVFVTTCLCHVAACTWVIADRRHAELPVSAVEESWLSVLIDAKGDCCTPDASHDPFCVYVLALYWAMMTLTTVGYGDISPQNLLEYGIAIVYMMASGFTWAWTVGSVVSLLSQLDPYSERFKSSVDALNHLMDQRNLPEGLRTKLREYMLASKSMAKLTDEQALLEGSISTGLQREVVWQTPVTSIILQKVYWSQDLEQDALLEIVRMLVPCIYGKDETIPMTERMIIIREGVIAVKSRILGRNDVYGESCILLVTQHLMNEATPRTWSYATVLSLTRDRLREVCEAYPAADQRLRRAQIHTAVWRGFIHAAYKAQKEAEAQKKAGTQRLSRTSLYRRCSDMKGELRGRKGSFAATIGAAGVTMEDLMRVESGMLEGQQVLQGRLDDIRETMDEHLGKSARAMEELRVAIEQLRLAGTATTGWRFRGTPTPISPRLGTEG